MENGGWVGQGYVEFREQPAQVLTLSHTQNMELLGVLFSIALAKCHFMGQTSQELWVGFFFPSTNAFWRSWLVIPVTLSFLFIQKYLLGTYYAPHSLGKGPIAPYPTFPITSHFSV